MKKIFILAVFVLIAHFGFSQNIIRRNIQWTSPSSVSLKSGEDVTMGATFTTYKQEKIEMQTVRKTLTFVITDVSTEWSDISDPGIITYNVTFGERTGQITIEKNSEGIFLILDMSVEDQDGMKQKFTISETEIL